MKGKRVITVSAISASTLYRNQSVRAATRPWRASSRVSSGATATAGLSGEVGASRMGGHGLPDKRLQLIAEHLAVELPGVPAQLDGIPGNVFCSTHRADQR